MPIQNISPKYNKERSFLVRLNFPSRPETSLILDSVSHVIIGQCGYDSLLTSGRDPEPVHFAGR